jgi:hypothetical protein
MNTVHSLACACLTLALFGCDETPAPGPAAGAASGKPGASAAAPAAGTVASAPDFSPWDFAAIRTAIQGTYVFKFNGSYQAWELRGAEATLYGDVLGKAGEDTQATVELVAPCRLRVKTGTEQTGTRASTHQFTVKDGFFPGSSGGIGMKKGDELVYCAGTEHVYRSGKAGCSEWKLEAGKWTRGNAKCGMRDHEGKPAFWMDLSSTDGMDRVVIDGDALFPGAFQQTPPLKVADYAAGKAKAKELEKR